MATEGTEVDEKVYLCTHPGLIPCCYYQHWHHRVIVQARSQKQSRYVGQVALYISFMHERHTALLCDEGGP